MTSTSRCANCGAELGDDAVDSLCPRCLLRLALDPPGGTHSQVDERFGQYRTIRVLGEGGMGIVYLAEQDRPIHRLVALKVIKLGMDTEEVIARFESERQALAMMDHPGIAQVYDTGSTPEGRPYFAMEYVEGIPITKYCDEHRLTVRERLQLFAQVCNAVQHAHQKGIIHRDLKPSNVLVWQSDGLVIPKIIDFGLAKALDRRLRGQASYTQLGVLLGTPEYMSPEQAGGGHAVDTRTDVYSLGLLLYELLAGTLPFDSQKLRRVAMDEVCRVIRHEEPPTAAHRLVTMGAAARAVAETRRVDVDTLARQLRGELQWIISKALEKEPARRYASVSELAADVMRHLHDEPVSAGPQRAAYRLRKLVRRHRTAAIVAATAGICLAAVTLGTTWLYLRAQRALESAAREQYKAAINAAALEIRMEEPTEARQVLLACKPSLRGWEWHHLLYRTDPTIAVWKAAGPLANPPGVSSDFAFAPDGRVFWRTVASVEEWLPTGTHARSLTADGETLALDGTARLLVSRSLDGRILITALDSTQPPVALDPGAQTMRAAAFDASGQRLALGSEDGWLQVWQVSPPVLQFQIPAHKGRIACIRFIAQGNRIGTVGSDSRVRLWSAESGKSVSTINERAASPWMMACTRDGKLLAFPSPEGMVPSQDFRVRIYETASGKLVRSYPCEEGITALAFPQTPNGRELAFVSDTGELQLCNEAIGCTVVRRNTNDPLNSLAYSPDRSLVYTGAESGEVAVWANMLHTGTVLPLPNGTPRSFAMHPSGKWAVGSTENEVQVWSAHNGLHVESWRGHMAQVNAVAVSPDGRLVASASDDQTARIWDRYGAMVAMLSGHSAAVVAIAFSRDGSMVATGSVDHTARLWKTSTGLPLAVLPHDGPVNSLAFSPSGRTLVTGSGDLKGPAGRGPVIREWDLDRRGTMRPFVFPDSPPGAAVSAVAFSPDGSRLLAARCGDAAIWVFDVSNGRALAKLAGHRGAILSMVFSPNGSRLATGSIDQTVRIWDAKDYTPLLELLGQNGAIYNIVFSPDGSRLYSAGYGVRTWDTKGRLPCTPDDPCCCPNPWPRMATAPSALSAGI